jgi:transcription-repair coupling factor (superfamily II helicase)
VKIVQDILERVSSDREVGLAFEDLRAGGEACLVGLSCSAKAMALARLHRDEARSLLVVVPDQEEAEALLGDLEVCLGEERIFFFAETEVIPYDRRSPHVGLIGERIPTLAALARSQPVVAVTTARAIAGKLPPPAEFERARLSLRVGQELPLEELREALVARGFRPERIVEEIGTFAVRGGLVDFYPFGSRNPVRVEFFGDEIESIRTFDAGSQRTVDEVREIDALPQRELMLTPEIVAAARGRGDLPFEEGKDPFVDGIEVFLPRFYPGTACLLDYLGRDGVIVLDEPARLADQADEQRAKAQEEHDELRSRGHRVPGPGELFLGSDELAAAFAGRATLRLALFGGDTVRAALRTEPLPEDASPTRKIRVNSQETFRGNFAVLRERLRAILDAGNTIFLLCDNQGQQSRLEEMLEDLADRIQLAVAPLRNGFSLPDHDLVVLTDHEMFARSGRRYRAFRYGGGAPIHDYSSLKKGDYVVHVDHGVGRYAGIQLLQTENVERECLLVKYQDEASVYVPVEQINLVQKYIGGEAGEPPVVARLGSTQWEKTKARVKKSVEKMASQLLEIHAARAAHQGHAFAPDDDWQREMEASFIYEETRDQRTATDAVKRDMMDTKPMDRLVCGDVGYGKTEVAIRAVFKAVTGGKQVAVLVPTTILAQQHLNTFRERLRAYPVKVEMLSRFIGPKEQRETLRRITAGEVDVVIGTHRLLSKDVEFRDLGLVVVDEEQRFGVKHKERLKELRKLVDVLTLTATPIPRTLNMALMGLREISVIDTPPPNKLPIVTEVVESSDEVKRKAIVREIQRGGQVFYVHNRVQSIGKEADHLRTLLPELRFDVAHGQMPERELEKVMFDFLERKSDVLVSTMIIESGLDLPNVNTILIHRADRFGLAQLYQLRGRVGRSNHRAFAHLLIPETKELSDIARKRLRAIEEFSELGAGFRLAMRDMEIRGAGNFLGPEQSGHVHMIGYDLYCQMLREAIADLRGEERPEERIPVRLDVELDAYLPEAWIDDPDQRIVFYKRLADLAETEALRSLSEELRDRYGRMPEPARNLLRLKEVRLLAEGGGVEDVRIRSDEATFRFARGREPSQEVVKVMVRDVPASLSFQADGREGLRILLRPAAGHDSWEGAEALLRAASASDTLTVSHASMEWGE